MADFTIQLKDILGVDTPTDHDPTKIGLDGYPVYSEGHRHELNTKIVKRFWNREIAHETIEMFRFRMDTLMCEIMPYYNRLFATTFEFDPFETVNLTVDNEGNTVSHGTMAGEQHGTDRVDGTTSGTSRDTTTGATHDETHNQEQSESESSQQSDSEAVAVASEYPQTRVVDGEHYATGSNESKSTSDTTSTAASDGSSTSTSDGTSTSESDSESEGTSTQQGENQSTSNQETDQTQNTLQQQVTQGFQGNKSELIQQYRDTIIGVDNQILAELEILFMGIWDTGGAYNRLENTYYPRNGFPYVY